MKTPQSKRLYTSVLLQSSWRAATFLVFVSLLSVTISCSTDDHPAPIDELVVISRIGIFGGQAGTDTAQPC